MKSFFQPRPSPEAAEAAELRSMMAAVQRSQAVIEFELDGTIITRQSELSGGDRL